MVFCSLIASRAIRAFISALKLRRCLDFISARFPRQRFYTLMSGPNFGEHFKQNKAIHFEASLLWVDGHAVVRKLSDEVSAEATEMVSYIPQHYIETICNE